MIEPFSFDHVKTYSIKDRKNLVRKDDFATPLSPGGTIGELVASLPRIYKGNEFRTLVHAMAEAVKGKKTIGVALGGHVIKCGLSPLLIDLIKRKIVGAIAMAGAGAIHDLEIAILGETSEDVSGSLSSGLFGMARETAQAFRTASKIGKNGKGLGRALGEYILEQGFSYSDSSLLATGTRFDIPTCVLLSTGADIIHIHPDMSGSDLGESSYIDFRLLVSVVSRIDGGVWLNIGSAVVLPEAFLKAVSVTCNMGISLKDLTTANFDMIDHYRPRVNVVSRPPGKGITLIGHHEIMIPLLRAALLEELSCAQSS